MPGMPLIDNAESRLESNQTGRKCLKVEFAEVEPNPVPEGDNMKVKLKAMDSKGRWLPEDLYVGFKLLDKDDPEPPLDKDWTYIKPKDDANIDHRSILAQDLKPGKYELMAIVEVDKDQARGEFRDFKAGDWGVSDVYPLQVVEKEQDANSNQTSSPAHSGSG